ncbi:hypothetical protein [Wenjunlia tyrosinilytica]|uniref:Uncharacterized protein n=1 Tax=Wenjunlia tyrosinilytica TaxID=1544741 RepID=A0A918DY64_9ACTN|nr:hypothetical protein [Wenjunlia tyrosinilytica]GGO87984.1 hypothetical protein GCM10012280_27730 [Wenjunlia tyrosinilytica]
MTGNEPNRPGTGVDGAGDTGRAAGAWNADGGRRTDGTGADGGDGGLDTRLLRDAVLSRLPRDLAAPPDRMDRVRDRVRRAGRRRAVGAAATVVPLVALASLALPGIGSDHRGPGPAASPTAPDPRTVRPRPSYTSLVEKQLHGLRLRMVENWRSVVVRSVGNAPRETPPVVAYVSNGPLDPGSGPCAGALDGISDGTCLPVAALGEDTVLISWHIETSPVSAEELKGEGTVVTEPPSPQCSAIGGTSALTLLRPVGRPAPRGVLHATACMNIPGDTVRAQTAGILRSARFPQGR